MEQLLLSADPLLALAGTLVLIGASFDLIFSDAFKRQVKEFVADPTLFSDEKPSFILLFARNFVLEVWKPKLISSFIWKVVALSVLFYLATAWIELSRIPVSVQFNFFDDLIQLRAPVVAVFMFHILFDIVSAYVTVLYLKLLACARSSTDVALILISDLIVTCFLWSLFFSFALVGFVKLADYEARSADVGIVLEEDQGDFWTDTSIYRTNSTLVAKMSLMAHVSTRQLHEPEFNVHTGLSFPIVTNIKEPNKVADELLRFVSRTIPNGTAADPVVQSEKEIIFFTFFVSHAMRHSDILPLVKQLVTSMNPVGFMLGSPNFYQYQAARMVYSHLLPVFFRDNFWDSSEIVVGCDGRFIVIALTSATSFDFGACKAYWYTSKDVARGLTLVAGFYLPINYVLSHRAFFWSSMALMASFYGIFVAVLFWRALRILIARQIAKGALNVEKGIFTCLFSAVSVLLLIAFGVKVIVGWAAVWMG